MQQISTDVPFGRLTINQLIASYKKTELPLKAHSTQELNGATLDNYIAVRWGKFYVDDIHVLKIKKWFIAIAEEKELTYRSIQKIKQVFGRLYSYGAENGLLAPNLNPVRPATSGVSGNRAGRRLS